MSLLTTTECSTTTFPRVIKNEPEHLAYVRVSIAGFNALLTVCYVTIVDVHQIAQLAAVFVSRSGNSFMMESKHASASRTATHDAIRTSYFSIQVE